MPHPDTEAGSCTRTHSKVPSRRADGSVTAARNRRHQWQALTENSLHSPAASVFQGVIPARYGPLPFSASMSDTGTLLFSPRCPAVPDALLRKKAFLLLFRFPHGSRTAMLFPASPTPCLRRLFRTAVCHFQFKAKLLFSLTHRNSAVMAAVSDFLLMDNVFHTVDASDEIF